MADFSADDSSVAWIGRFADQDTPTVRKFIGNNSEVWFRIYGDSLKIRYAALGADAFRVNIDNAGWTIPTSAIVNTGSTITLSGELLPGTPTDGYHDIKIRMDNGFTGGGTRIRLTDGIVVTSSGGVAARIAHSEFGQYEKLLGSHATSYWNETFGDALTGTTSNFTSPNFPAAAHTTSTTSCRNAYAEFFVDTDTTVLNVFTKFSGNAADSRFSIWVDDELVSNHSTPSSANGSYGTYGPVSVPGTGQRKIRISNLVALDGVIVDGAFVTTAVEQPTTKVCWSGDSVTAGDQVTNHPNASGNWDHLCNVLIGGYKSYNRGLAGDAISAFNSNSRVTNDIVPIDPDLVIFNLSINDSSNFNSSPTATRAAYVTALNDILANTSADIIVVPQLPYEAVYRTAVITGLQGAVADVNDPRCTYYSSDDWTSGVNDGSHPRDLGKAQATGGGAAAVKIAANPSDGDTITINGTAFEFDSNASSTGIAVTIGATLVDTINTLADTVNSQAGAYSTLERLILSGDTSNQGIALRGVTSLSVSGTNLTAYYDAEGWYDAVNSWINPPAPQRRKNFALMGVG